MSMEYKSQSYLPENAEKHPMNRLDKQYDLLIGEERKKNTVLVIINAVLLLYTLGSIFGWIYALRLPKSIPLVIQVSDWGEAKYLGDISQYSYGKIQIPEESRLWQIKEFVKNLRTLPSDPQVLHDNVSNLFYMITKSCESQVLNDVRNPDVFSLVGKRTVKVMYESLIRVSNKSYQLDWIEVATGEGSGQFRYRGIFTLEELTPTDKQKEKNPLGLFISGYDIVEIKGESR